MHLCYNSGGNRKKLGPLPQFNVSVPVSLRVPLVFSDILNKTDDLSVGFGQFYSGQMGLKGAVACMGIVWVGR